MERREEGKEGRREEGNEGREEEKKKDKRDKGRESRERLRLGSAAQASPAGKEQFESGS